MLTCPKCDFSNELGRIFCNQCGAKLDLTEIKPPSMGGKKLRRRSSLKISSIMWKIFEFTILAVILGVVFLVAKVPNIKSVKPTDDDLQQVYRKRVSLERSIDRKQAASVQLSEEELEAYLGRIAFEKGEGGGVRATPTKLQIRLGADQVTVIVLGQIELGTAIRKRFSVSCSGVAEIADKQFLFIPATASIGSLPIPPFVLENTGFIQEYFAQLFKNMSEEKRLLDRMTSLSVNKERVVFAYEP